MTSAGRELRLATRRLRAAEVDRPAADARLLLADSLGVGLAALVAAPDRAVDPERAAAYRRRIDRRCAREPVSRILGRREFWSLDFRLNESVLDPRPDSETVVEAVLSWRPDRTARLRILDFGAGSGCLLCALLHEYPAASGLGIDRAPGAVRAARANAAALGLAGRARFLCADWAGWAASRPGADRYDLIVANPPYLRRGEIDRLAPEVASFDPRAALDGGADGLDAWRSLAPAAAAALDDGGAAFVEIGAGQAGAVAAIMARSGLEAFAERADLGGVLRCLALRKPHAAGAGK